MKQPFERDRRRFLQLMIGAPLLGSAGNRSGWAAVLASPARKAKFAYVGRERAIHVYSIALDECFVMEQTIVSNHPVAMAISGGNLYVANGVSEFGGLPRGSVEAYGIDRVTGRLKLKNRVGLSLSGTLPRDLAVSPDGRNIVVAVDGGGAYNVLPVLEDGRVGKVISIFKELGAGPHACQAAAHPSAVTFDRAGRLLTTDRGTDRLSVWSLHNGELTVMNRCSVTAGSGPDGLVLHPGGMQVYVAQALNGSVSRFDYDPTNGRILGHSHTAVASGAGDIATLAIHPSGKVLYSSHGDSMQAWRVDPNGSLRAFSRVEGVQANKLHIASDCDCLLALGADAVLRMRMGRAGRLLTHPVKVANVSRPISIAVL